jgi:carboxypeptidase D
LPPAFTILPSVIEKSERTVIIHGLADFILIAEGARLVFQNMTWEGQQGFQSPLQTDTFIIDGIGAYGNMQSERGLTYYEVSLSGHMVPQFAPWVSIAPLYTNLPTRLCCIAYLLSFCRRGSKACSI